MKFVYTYTHIYIYIYIYILLTPGVHEAIHPLGLFAGGARRAGNEYTCVNHLNKHI